MRAGDVRRIGAWVAACVAALVAASAATAQSCARCSAPEPVAPLYGGFATDGFGYTGYLPNVEQVLQMMQADLQQHCRTPVSITGGGPFGPPSEWLATMFEQDARQHFFVRYAQSHGARIECENESSPRVIVRMERATCAPGTKMEFTATHEPVCVGEEPLVIRIDGSSSTRAMPAGPALKLRAVVTQGGIAMPFVGVTVSVAGGAALPGVTDGSGGYTFTYEPPTMQADTVTVNATCAGCVNTAEHVIAVDLPEGGEICVGNPIQLPAARKVQYEADWRDGSAHPIVWTRQYASSGALQVAGLGPGWSHAYAARLEVAQREVGVILGDGTRVRFSAAAGGRWIADNARDSLAPTPGGGWAYLRALDDTTFTFDARRQLGSITRRNGWTHALAYDAAGQLASITNAFGRRIDLQRDGMGRITAVSLPDGQALRYDYAGGQLATVTFADGAMRRYHYEDARDARHLTGWTDESGQRRASYAYDEQGRAVSSDDGAGRWQLELAPSRAGGIVAGGQAPAPATLFASILDPQGTRTDLSWGGADGATRRGDAADARFGPVASTWYAYRDLPSDEVDFTGARTHWDWNFARQLPVEITEAAGRPEARTRFVMWHWKWRLPVRIEQDSRITDLAYDDAGNLKSATVVDAQTGTQRRWSWQYDARGLAASMTDPRGATWSYGYDGAGNLSSVVDPLGSRTSIERDAGARITRIDMPDGSTTRYGYDARGRRVTQRQGDELTTYAYTPTGKLASATFPDDLQLRYAYDALDRLIGAQDNRGASVRYELDAMGNRIREDVVDATGRIALRTRRVFDAFNRLVAVEGTSGIQRRYGYDGNGRLVDEADALNQWTRQALDGIGRTVSTTLADGARVGQTWDALDALVQVLDPKQVETRYGRNAFGDIVAESSPDTGTWKYARNAAGDVVRVEDAKGQATTITRDAIGNPVLVERSDGVVHSYTYDTAGRPLRIDDKASQTDYAYDALHGITAKTQTMRDSSWAPTRLQLRYGYEPGGGLSSIGYPSGMRVLYRRVAGRLVGIDVQRPARSSAAPFVLDLQHTALGQPQSWRWASGDAAGRTFDTDGRMTANEFARYTWDAAGRITAISQDLAVQRPNGTPSKLTLDWQAAYDTRNRLVRFARAGSQTRYTYDANSNRIASIEATAGDADLDNSTRANTQVTTEQTLDVPATSNRLLGFTQTLTRTQANHRASESSSTVRFEVDANGSMTSDGLRRYEYDAGNRMSRVFVVDEQGNDTSVEYRYNALGQRVFKGEPKIATPPEPERSPQGLLAQFRALLTWLFTGGRTQADLGTSYIYGDGAIPAWALLGEYDNGSAKARPATEYIWLPTEDGSAIPIGMQRSGRLYAIHTDHLGTPRLVTDESRSVAWQWEYSAFGEREPIGIVQERGAGRKGQRTNEPLEFSLRFAGQVIDREAATAYNLHRTYDASSGRYRERDPIGLVGGLNPFVYAHGDPLAFNDPEGLFEWGDALPDELVNACAGFGDGVSFGLTSALRSLMGTNDEVDISSGEYIGGVIAGAIVTGKGYAAGAELSIGRNFRFAPWGNRTGHPTGRYPHYHRRGAPDANGRTPPGQGIGRHRPWDKKSTDQCGCDRF